MMKNVLLILSFVFFSCNKEQKTIGTEQDVPSSVFKMYTMSEMALLMEQMYVANEKLREQIIKGDSIGEMPTYFSKITSAHLTNEKERDTFFIKKQLEFLNKQSLIYDETKDSKLTYNEMVDACITCHKVKCGGPISRIKKLYIP